MVLNNRHHHSTGNSKYIYAAPAAQRQSRPIYRELRRTEHSQLSCASPVVRARWTGRPLVSTTAKSCWSGHLVSAPCLADCCPQYRLRAGARARRRYRSFAPPRHVHDLVPDVVPPRVAPKHIAKTTEAPKEESGHTRPRVLPPSPCLHRPHIASLKAASPRQARQEPASEICTGR